jgi:hypothetical protein
MWRSRKALDLQRDPRFALHSGSDDPPGWEGNAEVGGHAEEVTDPEKKEGLRSAQGGEAPSGPWHLFRSDINELVVTHLNESRDRLLVEFWREGEGVRRIERG